MVNIKSCIEKIDISDSIEKKLISVKEAINAIRDIKEPKSRKDSFLNIASRLPKTPEFQPLYTEAVNNAIDAADAIPDKQHRTHALLCIANELPGAAESNPLRLRAMRLALNLKDISNHSHYSKDELEGIAKGLPKSSDYSFYRQYTFLGVAKMLPKTGEFLALYKEAIGVAIAATNVIPEPYYRKYALVYIANELHKTSEFHELHLKALTEAFRAATEITDLLIKTYTLIDILKEIPITPLFFPLLQQILKEILNFFSMKMMFKDINATEIIDYILVAEEKGINESKKAKYTKTKYAVMLAKELERFGLLLNDIRFIEILKPYTHVWVQPKELRFASKKIVDRLEGLQNTYHGKEIERPLFVKEVFHASDAHYPEKKQSSAVKECLSIDIGATNTVIMKRRRDSQPEFISLNTISRQYGDVPIIPTVMDINANSIGTGAIDNNPITDFKKMLLEGRPEGREYMERYINILYQHLKKEIENPRWLSIFSDITADRIYVTVPVGFPDYKRNLKEIMERIMRGAEIEFLEEPLAAAIGYQVAEERDRIVMVIDFGGNTLDVMMLRLNLNDAHVIAKPDRSKMLGGRDIDIWLTEYLSEKMGMDNESPSMELINKAEDIKIALTNSREVSFHWKGAEVCRVSRGDFEEILAKHDFYKTVDRAVLYVLHRAKKIGITKEKIEAVLLTGGSSLIPSFKEKIAALFPGLYEKNAIYSHSPFSAVATGASLYGTRNIIDRHLGLGYAVRYTTKDEENPYAYEIIFEKGEAFPFEKTYKIMPAETLGEQRDIYIELFEVPENYIVRRWEREGETEVIKQAIRPVKDMNLMAFGIITLSFEESVKDEVYIRFYVDEAGHLKIHYGKENKEIETGIRLQ
ncbi:MAG: Hsp70 family protein [Nitrospirae bacterium]|nr:Hsp70 family protein [Nitrospirota bacterium]